MKKIISLFFIILLITIETACAKDFSDVSEKHLWALDAITSLSDSGVISGYPDGTFKPDNNITNAEAAKLITLIFGNSDVPTAYNDVTENSWYYDYVKNAGEYFLRNENFRPEDFILRKETAYALYKATGIYKLDSQYKETLKEDEKYARSLSYLSEIGIIVGYPDGSLGEENNVTRAEFAVIIKRISDYNDKNSDENEAPPESTDKEDASETDKEETAEKKEIKPHNHFFVVTDTAVTVSENGDTVKKISGYNDGKIDEAYIDDAALISSLDYASEDIRENDILYLFKDYYGNVKNVINLARADTLSEYDSVLLCQFSAKQKYIYGVAERIINDKAVEIRKNRTSEDETESYRFDENTRFYLYENGKITLSRSSKIKENNINGQGDYIFCYVKDDVLYDVLIIKK